MSENKVNLPEGQREGALGHVVAVRSIEIVTAEIHTIRDNVARVFMDGVVQIGRRLEEVKQLVPQGEWLAYLDKELGYKPSTAQNYIYGALAEGAGGQKPKRLGCGYLAGGSRGGDYGRDCARRADDEGNGRYHARPLRAGRKGGKVNGTGVHYRRLDRRSGIRCGKCC